MNVVHAISAIVSHIDLSALAAHLNVLHAISFLVSPPL